MWSNIIITVSLFSMVTSRRQLLVRDDFHPTRKSTHEYIEFSTTDQTHSPKAEAMVEKFIKTVTSSEKYLKMIETVDRKLRQLALTYNENSNSVLKYLNEILKIIKTSSPGELENVLKTVKLELENIKKSFPERVDQHHIAKSKGDFEFHADSALNTRLSVLDSHLKSVQTGVDSIVATISEVKNRQYSRAFPTKEGWAGNFVDPMSFITEFRKTLREQKNSKKCECRTALRVDRSERYPTDCHEIQVQGFNVSGIYKIKPDDMEPFYVLCDLTTAGGGWTVFQNRFDGSQDFYKGWSDYEHGFGNLAGEFWLGLDKLNYLTNQKLYELRVELETQQDQEAYSAYSVFTVGPEQEGYRISTLGTYYGTAGDSLSYHAGQKFSTFDTDNDEWKDGACAKEHGGAWWYKECDKSNLNGKYSITSDENRGQSMYWISFKGPNFPLSKTKMMIRPLPASKPIDYTDSPKKLLEGLHLGPHSDNLIVMPIKTGRPTRTQKSHNQYRKYDKSPGTGFFQQQQ